MDQVEDIIQFMIEHLQNASLEVRLAAVDRAARMYFPEEPGLYLFKDMWETHGNITWVSLRNNSPIGINANLAMMKEKLNLGPKYYWIISKQMPGLYFYNRLFCLMRMLPREKFCFMPKREISPSGLFLSIPGQREVAETLFKQRIPLSERPHECPRCHLSSNVHFIWCPLAI